MLEDPLDSGDKPRKLVLVYQDYSGGLRRNVNPAAIEDNEYALLINGRNRNGNLTPIKGLTDFSEQIPIINRNMQGLYAFDSIVLLFASGAAFAKDFSVPNSSFQQVPGVFMDENVSTIYAEAVPASWMNLQRKAEDGESASGGMAFYSEVFGTPSCIVCQDAINTPFLIFSTGQARRAKQFKDWRNDELTGTDTREYVPVGRQMLYSSDGILYIVSPDGKKLFRSVTGRPLDFVVAVDTNGDKLPPLSSGLDEAYRMSYNLDYSEITCLRGIGAKPRIAEEGEGFLVCTRKKSWIVYPDYSTTLYGEPVFSNQTLFPTGAINQFSVTDILGDTALITETGITSFNSILTVSNEGKNAPFHDKISLLFDLNGETLVQQVTASITTDNYGLFAVNTAYGQAVLVFDTLRQQWTSIDLYEEIEGYIKQFCEVKVNGQRYVYCITTGGQFFELYTGAAKTMSFYLKEATSPFPEREVLPLRVRVLLENVVGSGSITVTPFVDSKAGDAMTQTFTNTEAAPLSIPIEFPFGNPDIDNVQNKTFKIETPMKGDRAGLYISITGNAEVDKIEFICDTEESKVSQQEAGEIFAASKTL